MKSKQFNSMLKKYYQGLAMRKKCGLFSYRNQSPNLLCKSIDWFLYDRKPSRHYCIIAEPKNKKASKRKIRGVFRAL